MASTASEVPGEVSGGVIVIGLTGGIGSGKTTVSAGLVERGALLIDADAIVHELQQPGGEVLAAMVAEFGDEILAADGSLNRAAVAALVFSDSGQPDSGQSDSGQPESGNTALEKLNAIVHPPVGREIRKRLLAAYDQTKKTKQIPSRQIPTKQIVVLDIPLLAEGLLSDQPSRYALSGVLVVDTPQEVAIERLVTMRKMPRADAAARIASQVSQSERLSVADHVLTNAGSMSELAPLLDAAYAWAQSLPPTEAAPTEPAAQ